MQTRCQLDSKGALEDKFCYKWHVETCGFVVSWFHSISDREPPMKPRNLSKRFHGFITYLQCWFSICLILSHSMMELTKPWYHETTVSWFQGFAHSYLLKWLGFRGFEVSWFRLLCLWVTDMSIGFMVSWFRPLPYLGHQNDCRFHKFIVSLFHSLPSLKMTRFHGFEV